MSPDVLSRKIYALRNRALKEYCEPEVIMIDYHTYSILRECRELDFYPKMLFMGMPVEGHASQISMYAEARQENELVGERERLLCLRAKCLKTGRVMYFDDAMTTPGFLPRVTALEQVRKATQEKL